MAGTTGAAVRASTDAGVATGVAAILAAAGVALGAGVVRVTTVKMMTTAASAHAAPILHTLSPERQDSSWPNICFSHQHRSAGAACYRVGCFKTAGMTERFAKAIWGGYLVWALL